MPWRCSSLTMRASVQRLCLGLSAFAVDLGLLVVTGAEAVVVVVTAGAVAAAGAAAGIAGGRSTYFGASTAGAASLIWSWRFAERLLPWTATGCGHLPGPMRKPKPPRRPE